MQNNEIKKTEGNKIRTIISYPISIYYAIRKRFSLLSIFLIAGFTLLYLKDAFIDSIWLDETWYAWVGQLIHQRLIHILDLVTNSNPELIANIYSVTFGYDKIFPSLIIAIFNFFFVSFTAMRLMGITFAVLGLVFTYLLAKDIKNEFTGIAAMLLVAIQHWYYFLALKGLIDVAILSMIVMFTYFLNIAVKKPTIKNISIAFIVAVLTILTKAQGMVVIPLTILYLAIVIVYRRNEILPLILNEKRYQIGAASGIVAFIAIGYIFSEIITVYIRNAIFDNFLNIFMMLPSLIYSNIIIVGFIAGVIISIAYKKQEYNLLMILALSLFLPIATYPSVEMRILLPIIVPIYILGVIGLQEISSLINLFLRDSFKHSKLMMVLILGIILMIAAIFPNYSQGRQLIDQRKYWYNGYPEAMQWVHENIPWNGKDIFVPNFFGCCNYNVGLLNDDIRRINNSKVFNNFEEFKKYVYKNNDTTVYVMPDAWEPYQSEWHRIDLSNPEKTQKNLQQLQEFGFKLVYQGTSQLPTDKGMVDITTIMILKRN